jgi:DNA-binding XRE family transcriptional regulator
MFDPAKVRGSRLGAGLTNEQLAHAAGVTLRTVQRWQDGKSEPQNFSQARRLAQALGVSVDDLYSEQPAAA